MRHLEYMKMMEEKHKPRRRIIGSLTTKVHSKKDLEELENKNKTDMVNNPSHYNEFGIECIDAIQAATGAGFESYLQGNIMKYLWRYKYKGKPIEDLQKAEWYLSRLISTVKNGKIKNNN
tara:strand:+ start:168 stop:527 length:360 start_codon:yes stop_codon:yes gene_type:complete